MDVVATAGVSVVGDSYCNGAGGGVLGCASGLGSSGAWEGNRQGWWCVEEVGPGLGRGRVDACQVTPDITPSLGPIATIG